MTPFPITRTTRAGRTLADSVSTDTYNLGHLIDVGKARKARGLPDKPHPNRDLPTHHLTGRFVRDRETGKVYKVEKAFLSWHWGWYVALMLECNGSHGVRWWKNLTSGYRGIDEAVREAHATLEVLPMG